MTDHLDVALALAEHRPVFPCLPTKQPACRRGFHDATTDRERVRSWWSRHPDHLVGMPTEGLLVVDLDVDPDGSTWWTWCQLAEPHGWTVLDCPVVATPSGGLHVYFTAPDGAEVRNSASKLGRRIDTRASGGYVIAPGSTLPDGRRYEQLHNDLALADAPVAPAWLVELCARPVVAPVTSLPRPGPVGGSRYGVRALEAELGRLATAAEGTRNDTLVKSAYRAGQLVAGGELDAHHAHDQLLGVALRIGLAQREAEATIASGMRSGAQAPRKAS